MEITLLGTGNALVTECYNTCFVISHDGKHFLVDGGGGNTLLAQLKHAGFHWMDMREIFVTHKHIDHILGIIWMMRMICQYMNQGQYQGEANIYGHREVISILRQGADTLLKPKETWFIDERLHLIVVEDGDVKNIMGREVAFFDIRSTKAKQFGFFMALSEGGKLTCCGDEPCPASLYDKVRDSRWLLHEAFCLYNERDIWHPYEKNHSTAKDAAQLAEALGIENLVLYHTEDSHMKERKELYTKEAKQYFTGNIYVPDDLEVIACK